MTDGDSAAWMERVRATGLLSRTSAGLIVVGIGLATAVRPDPAAFGIAAPLALAGAAIRFWSAGIIAKNQELATSGPYAYVRNPLYLGSLLVALSFLVLNGNPWFALLAVAGAAVLYTRTIRAEEAILRERFGEVFATYRARVPALLPWKGRCALEGGETAYSLEQSLHNKEYAGTLGVLGMLALFYIYLNWIPQTPFRVGAGGIAALVVAVRAVRVSTRRQRERAAGPPPEPADTIGPGT